MDTQQYYQRQVSFTEWFQKIQHAKTKEMREEDNEKRERLRALNEAIGLPFDKPVQFTAIDIVENTPAFQDYCAQHGDDLCAMRLIPFDHSLPKLRIRGKSVRDSLAWFREQVIDPKQYRVDLVPHSDRAQWSTCFVVNQHGIFGEIIRDEHTHLTQGFYGEGRQPIVFYYDWNRWVLMEHEEEAREHLKAVTALLKVADAPRKELLIHALGATFSHDYLCGYFETVASPDHGTWFIDYNRILGEMYREYTPVLPQTKKNAGARLTGLSACRGIARGMARIVREGEIQAAHFDEGDILVCDMTSPLYIPLMQKAGAIVTDRGGMLSHAAIVSRELGKPCITATKNATKILKDGEMVEVNADEGWVKRIP